MISNLFQQLRRAASALTEERKGALAFSSLTRNLSYCWASDSRAFGKDSTSLTPYSRKALLSPHVAHPLLKYAAVLMLVFSIGVGNVWGQSTTYTSNVTFNGGTNGSTCKVIVTGSTQYDGMKLGTGKATGAMTFSVPEGTTTIHIHAAGWNNDGNSRTLSISTSRGTLASGSSSMSLTNDAGVSNNSPFTLSTSSNASTSYYKSLSISGVTGGTATITITTSSKRAVVWGVNAVAAASCTTNPTVTAGSNSSVTSTTATVSCSSGISSLGSAGCSISSYGFVIGTSANPAVGGSGVTKHEVGTTYTTTGTSFSKNLTGLSASTTYYVRPYATNGYGTAYGTQTSFTTSALPKYTVTLKDNDAALTQASAGASVTLPSRTGCTGYTFAGWTKSWATAQTTWTTTAPTIIAAGSYTPTANENLYPVYTKTESGGGTSDDYELYSGTLTEGDYIIYYDGKAMNTTVTSDRLQYEEVTPSEDVITTTDASIIWHIAPSGDYWTIYNADEETYAASTGVKNKAQMLEDGTDDKSLWTVSGTETYEFVNKQNTTNSVNANLRNNGTYGFACYATSTGGALSLYKNVTGGSTTSYISVPNCCTALGQINGSVSLTTSGTSFTVKDWDEVSNASSYTIKLYKYNGSSWALTNNTSATSTSGDAATKTGITDRTTGVTFTNLTYGADYKITIQAVGNGSTFCDGTEAAVTAVNTVALTDNKIPFNYSVYIDDATNANYAHNIIQAANVSSTTGTIGINLSANKDYYQYKIAFGAWTESGTTKGLIWSGNEGKMTSSNCTDWNMDDKDNNCKLQSDLGGTYNFSVNFSSSTPQVSVIYPSASQLADKIVYWDASIHGNDWSKLVFRAGTSSNSNARETAKTSANLVPGTDQFYKMLTCDFASMAAWTIADNTGWTGTNSVYKTNTNDSYAVTKSIEYQDYVVVDPITIIPTTSGSTGDEDQNNNCTFYTATKYDGMLKHTATISSYSNGTVTVAYTKYDGTGAASFTSGSNSDLAHRTNLTITATPATGYKLTSLQVNGAAFTSGNTHILAADATIAATFTAKQAAITFDKNSGTGGSDGTTATYGSTMTSIIAPTRTGYTFGGYYDAETDNNGSGMKYYNANGTSARNWDKNTESATTLYANWTKNNYTLTWNLNGGKVTTAGTGAAVNATGSPSSNVAYGTTITAPVVTKEGYDFTGWSPSVASTMPAAATTYTAQWTLKKYTVTWHVGESTTPTTNVTHGTTFSTLEASAPAHADDALTACGSTKFIGWVKASGIYTEDGGTVDLYNTHKFSGSDQITADTHVYAMYAEASGVGTNWVKYEENDFAEGDYLLIQSYSTYKVILKAEVDNTPRFTKTTATITDGVVTSPDSKTDYIWRITKSGNYYKLYNAKTGKYIVSTGTKSQANLVETPSNDKDLFTINYNSTSHQITMTNKYNSTNNVNADFKYGGDYWACYSGTANIDLYHRETSYSNYRTGCTVSCGAPSSLTNTGVTKTGATISWTDGDNGTLSKYEYAVWVDGDEEPTSGFTDNGKNTSKALTGLYSGIKYNWKVRKVCTGSDGESRWSYSSFTTTAATLTFSVPTGVAAVSNQESNINLPEAGVPTSCGSCWAFAGWTASTSYSDEDAPADLMLAGTKARVSGDKTLYAVYKNDRFMLIGDVEDLTSNADYVLTYLNSTSENAMSNTPHSTYTKAIDVTNVTSKVRETGEGYFIFNPENNNIWHLTGTASSAQFYNAAADKYLNLTTLDASILSTIDNLTFSVNDIKWTIHSTNYLRAYDADFGAVASLSGEQFSGYLYKRVETSYATDPACDAYTVTWMRDKVAISGFESQSVTQCEGITTLPGTQTKLTCSNVHVGWSASEIMPASDVRPADFFTRAEDAPEITGNTTFYAVFADQSVGAATATNTTYTFNTASWGDETNSWNSTTAGSRLTSGQGIQITGSTSAVGVTKDSYTAVTKVVVTYCTNNKGGAGTIAVKVGDTEYGSNTVTKPSSGGTTLKTFTYTHAATDGKVTVTASATVNSIYIYSVQIFYTGSAVIYSNYRTSCCNNSNFTFGTIADPVTEYVIVREDLESASDGVTIDCDFESANKTSAITWASTHRDANYYAGNYTWSSTQAVNMSIDISNKKITSKESGVWTITLEQAMGTTNYCDAVATVRVVVKTVDKFIDNVNGNFGGESKVREDTGDGILLPTEAEFTINNGCADGKVRRLVGWIKESDLGSYKSSGSTGFIDDLKTGDASNKVFAPGTRVSATGITWYAVWGIEQ